MEYTGEDKRLETNAPAGWLQRSRSEVKVPGTKRKYLKWSKKDIEGKSNQGSQLRRSLVQAIDIVSRWSGEH